MADSKLNLLHESKNRKNKEKKTQNTKADIAQNKVFKMSKK